LERNHQLTAADIAALDAFIHTCEQDAIDDTQTALAELHSIRDGYSNSLRTAEKNLAVDGYDPSRIWGVDNHEPETPDQAEQDVHDALAGDQGAAGRVNAVLGSITPDQLAGKVPLTAEQASVLSQLQAQEHGMSVDALTTAEQRLGAQRGMIANSWQLMSNPNISFPKTQLTVGAKQGSDTVKGG
ncbi:TPR repeat region-containing protein, partial [Mycobacterium kansasii]